MVFRRQFSFLLATGMVVLLSAAGWVGAPLRAGGDDKATDEEVKQVRAELRWKERADHDESMKYLLGLGQKKAFAAFEAILDKPVSEGETCRVFYVLRAFKGDRKRFVERAVRCLTAKYLGARSEAAAFLGDVGTAAEASPLVALLSDEEPVVTTDAAEALGKIGGPNELVALDVWLQGASHRDYQDLRERVQKSRREIQKRLDRAAFKR